MSMQIREGGCACNSVRYRILGEPIMVHNCHCRLCQKQTGSTSVVNAFIETDNVTLLSGELSQNMLLGGSGNPHTVFRCAACGTAVWSHYPRFGSLLTGFRAGTLDDPDSVTPDVAIFTDYKMAWVSLPENIPSFAESYDPAATLPAASMDRLAVLAEQRKAGEG